MELLWIGGLAIATLVFAAIGSGTNSAAAVSAPLFFVCALLLYFSPAILAHKRQHANAMAITVLNIVLGWTVLGWVVSLVWAFTASTVKGPQEPAPAAAPAPPPQPASTRACPHCAEQIQRAARVCRFCGRDVEPV